MASKNLKVIVKDTSLLELAEDGKAGDLIDLNHLTAVDTTYLKDAINLAKDEIYRKKLTEEKEKFDAAKALEVNELKHQLAALEEAKKSELLLKEKDLTAKYSSQIQELTNQLSSVKKDFDNSVKAFKTNKENEISSLNSDKELAIAKIRQEDADKYNVLKTELEALKASHQAELANKILEVKNEYEAQLAKMKTELENANQIARAEKDSLKANLETEKTKEIQSVRDDLLSKLKEKEDQVAALQNQKARMNVKQIGEDLESYCNSLVESYMQNGFFNCDWKKDNDVVRDPGEEKGSKADYIFRVYADENKKEDQLLTSVCLDMKDENPDSVNRQTNEHYFKALDKNRTKKNCKYAVLVSNLELDKNLSEITKVKEYPDMYIVRPGYLMVFLNMVTSLSNNFRTLILEEAKEQEVMKTANELNAEYEALQKTYLDAPLEALAKRVEEINAANETIVKASDKIHEATRKITDSYIGEITKKLEKFGKGLKKIGTSLEDLKD